MRVERLGDYAATSGGGPGKAPQETARATLRADHPEVLAEEDDRVEKAERRVDGVESEEPSVSNASPPAALDCPGRGVDTDDLDPTFLEIQTDSTAATTDVEDAAAGEAHRPALGPVVPFCEGCDEIAGVESHDEAVIPLDDLHRPFSGEQVAKDSTVNIIIRLHQLEIAS